MHDVAAERGVLAGLWSYGAEAFDEVRDLLRPTSFTQQSNQSIYRCLESVLAASHDARADFPSFYSSARALGLSDFFDRPEERRYLESVARFPVERRSVGRLAARVSRLEVARLMDGQLQVARENLAGVTGDEPVDRILALAEGPVFDLSALLHGQGGGPRLMGDGALEYVEHLLDNPRQMIGISTGMPRLDRALGGGLRPNSVDVIAARPKTGKAQPLDALVMTPYGPRPMGTLRVGSRVLTPYGESRVASLHPQGEQEVVRVVLGDGSSAECTWDHLWSVRVGGEQRLVTTREMADLTADGVGCVLPVAPARFHPSRHHDHPEVPAYRAGWLAVRLEDGSDDEVEALGRLGMADIAVRRRAHACYLCGTYHTRQEFLRGALDAAGTKAGINFVTVWDSEALAEQVAFLARSLGWNARQRGRRTALRPPADVVWEWRGGNYSGSAVDRRVMAVQVVGRKPCQCIKLEDERGLYFTDHFIVTHNTQLVDNIALHVAGVGGVPVFNLDTEMSWEEHLHRVVANLAGVPVYDIETGRCGSRALPRQKVLEAAARLRDFPYHYECVIGKAFEEVLASMRRWVTRTVGLGPDGRAKPCVVIYDYLKLMSADFLSGDLKEYQALGFIATALKNFMGRYGVPCLCFAQLNREGSDREDGTVISGSDRIIHYCTSFTIYKMKSDEERAEATQGGGKYTHKLVPVLSRHGEGLRCGDYINVAADYRVARVREGPTRYELEKGVLSDEEPDGGVSL